MSSHSENSKLIKNIMTMNTDYSYCSGGYLLNPQEL